MISSSVFPKLFGRKAFPVFLLTVVPALMLVDHLKRHHARDRRLSSRTLFLDKLNPTASDQVDGALRGATWRP
jgi:hypothetical protein